MEINPAYSGKLDEVKKAFAAEFPSVSLNEFLEEDSYKKFKDKLRNLQFKKEKEPLFHSYSKVNLPKDVQEFFNGEQLLSLLSTIIGKKVKRVRAKVFSFTWKDYKILNDLRKEEPGYDLVFSLNDEWDSDAGASIFYVDGTGEYHELPPLPNTLTVTERTENVQSFIQYLNHYAYNKKVYTVLGKIEVDL